MSGIADPQYCTYCRRWQMGGTCTKKQSRECFSFIHRKEKLNITKVIELLSKELPGKKKKNKK